MWLDRVKPFLKKLGLHRSTFLFTVMTLAGADICVGYSLRYYGEPVSALPFMVALLCCVVYSPVPFYVAYRIIEDLDASAENLETMNGTLHAALQDVRELKDLLPLCPSCKKVRDDKGYWRQVEAYLSQRAQLEFSHGLCPDCVQGYLKKMDLPETPS